MDYSAGEEGGEARWRGGADHSVEMGDLKKLCESRNEKPGRGRAGKAPGGIEPPAQCIENEEQVHFRCERDFSSAIPIVALPAFVYLQKYVRREPALSR